MGSSFIHLIRTDSNEFFLMAGHFLTKKIHQMVLLQTVQFRNVKTLQEKMRYILAPILIWSVFF